MLCCRFTASCILLAHCEIGVSNLGHQSIKHPFRGSRRFSMTSTDASNAPNRSPLKRQVASSAASAAVNNSAQNPATLSRQQPPPKLHQQTDVPQQAVYASSVTASSQPANQTHNQSKPKSQRHRHPKPKSGDEQSNSSRNQSQRRSSNHSKPNMKSTASEHANPSYDFSTLKFTDIGVNLLASQFHSKHASTDAYAHIDPLIQRARRFGTHRLIVTAGSLQESRDALALCLARPDSNLFCTVGCHPTRASEACKGDAVTQSNYWSAMRQCVVDGVNAGKCVAIGECGLDYDRLSFAPKEAQLHVFPRHFKLAREFDLPVFLHDRNTAGDLSKIMNQHQSQHQGIKGVVHSFTGSMTEMQSHLSCGLYIGINGCSFKTPENCNVASSVPIDRLMLETDAAVLRNQTGTCIVCHD